MARHALSRDPTIQLLIESGLEPEPDDRRRFHVRMSSAKRITSEEELSVSRRLEERAIRVAIPVGACTEVRVSYKNNLEWLA